MAETKTPKVTQAPVQKDEPSTDKHPSGTLLHTTAPDFSKAPKRPDWGLPVANGQFLHD